MSKKKAFSPEWAYFGFKPDTNDESKPICRLCGRLVLAKASNTSNLFSHLKNKHPRQYAEIKSGTSSSSTSKESTGPSSQVNIKKSFENGQPYTRNSKRWVTLTNSVSYAIAKDMLPFTAVEKPGFKKMLSSFDSRYQLPSRKYFSKTGIPQLYNSTKASVEEEIKGVKHFSATTDLWSSEDMHPYMSLTIHFLTASWELKNLCLQTTFLPCDHTGDNLADALKSALDSWELKKEQLMCITTDSGSNIIKATHTLGWRRLSCFGHNLNLAVTKSLKNDHRISRALGLARKIVSAFSSSWKRRRELGKAQAEKCLPQHSLINVR